MRHLHVSPRAERAWGLLAVPGTPEREALERVIYSLMDERVPLVGPEDRAIEHGSSVMGRLVPGTDLVVCFVPAGPEVYVINLVRR